MTHGCYATLCHPKMHAQSKFGIPTSKNIRDKLRIREFYKLGQGHSDPKMVSDTPYPHTESGIPTSKNIGNIDWTQRGKDGQCDCFVCCFTSKVNSYVHCGTVSSPNHTFFLGKLEQAVNQ